MDYLDLEQKRNETKYTYIIRNSRTKIKGIDKIEKTK